MLADAFDAATAKLKAFQQVLEALSARPIRIDFTVNSGGTSDRAEAEAIKRGQKPESIAAIKKVLGL